MSLTFKNHIYRARTTFGVAAALTLCTGLLVSAPAFAAKPDEPGKPGTTGQPLACENLVTLDLPDTTITLAASLPAGTFGPIDTAACRVVGTISPTSDSQIVFEVWMPTGGWNGKFLSAGEGGFAGNINYGGIADALRRGYAGGSTDTGHAGGSADFAPGHPEKVIDYGWRGKHLQAVRSKDIIRAFYGESPRHSYFSSCSNGGRQALMELQRFPEDYDGVIVGAPAYDWTNLMAGFVWNEQALWNTLGAHVNASKLAAVQAATLATCDALDGVEDGVVEDPRRCQFDPASIACPAGTDGDSCLTPPQIDAVRKIMEGPRNPRTGEEIFTGYFTSAAAEPGSWPAWITGPEIPGASIQGFFGNGFFGHMMYEIPAPGVWDFSTFNFDSDLAATKTKLESVLSATDPDLRPFRRENRRGKIIMWHGWEDPAISAHTAVAYYRELLRETPNAHAFFRLFMVPGMLHCGGGPGPNAFGQNLPQSTPLSHAPEHDILSALEQWVEKGKPPKRIVAVKYVNDDPEQGILRTRPLCAYPAVAVYTGKGSTDEAANFKCRLPKGFFGRSEHGRDFFMLHGDNGK